MPSEPPPADIRVDDRVVLGPSTIAGLGLFAADDIAEGAVVMRLGGHLVSSAALATLIADADRDAAAAYVDTITIDEDAHLVLPSGSVAHYGNHSCDPTIWHVSPYELATRRPVRHGEELTIDYATNSGADGFTMACECRSPICRGRVTSDDWRRPDLQARYRGHWTPALQQRIDRS
jgi:SET domain-containing protein